MSDPPRKVVCVLYVVNEDGLGVTELGRIHSTSDVPRFKMRREAIEKFWDPRLDSASCSPGFTFIEEV